MRGSNPAVGGGGFLHPSRPSPEPTQPPVQWVPGLSLGVKRPGRGADHPLPSKAPSSGECRAIPLPPLWAFESVTGTITFFASSYTVRSESGGGRRLRDVDLIVSFVVGVSVCCCFTVLSC
jgi:hypothetical protein